MVNGEQSGAALANAFTGERHILPAFARFAFTFAFTVLITTIMIAGSVWIMHHLNTNMQHRMDNEAVIPR